MPVKIRLARRGRKKQPFYHIIIADSRAPRDGKFIEQIGSYNPMTKPATIKLDRDRAFDWLEKGAQPTETVRAILRFKGVLFKKHLQRGVKKGALTQEEADSKYNEFVEAKEAKVLARFEETAREKAEFYKKLSGSAKKVVIDAAPAEEAAEAFREDGSVEATTEETPAVEEAETPAVSDTSETPSEPVAEDTASTEETPAPTEEEKPAE
ncbi:MAG: 30S ribosomal protein S16 [Bacteroidota bacterium]